MSEAKSREKNHKLRYLGRGYKDVSERKEAISGWGRSWFVVPPVAQGERINNVRRKAGSAGRKEGNEKRRQRKIN